jgi:hypothetical protein
MVIYYLHFLSIILQPIENNPPLIIYSDTVETFQIS